MPTLDTGGSYLFVVKVVLGISLRRRKINDV